MFSPKAFTGFAVSLCLVTAACGDDDNDGVNLVEQPTGGNGVMWQTVYNERYTDMIVADSCDMPFRFEVDPEGNFTAGPCTAGGSDFKDGMLTANETAELNRLAAIVADNNLANRNCQQGGIIAGGSTDMELNDGERLQVYKHHPDELCHRGDRAEAEALHTYVSNLSEKYYPTASN